MTLSTKSQTSTCSGKQLSHNIRNPKTAQALKRYLDLTLTGTKKSLAEHGSGGKNGRKEHPPSPYTFDKPDIEGAILQALRNQSQNESRKIPNAPGWVQQINEKICNHSGEAPMFSEHFLSSSKSEQSRKSESRPLSGISTKSAPVVINGEMFYRPDKKHSFLQASHRPCSAKEDRLTRASRLRNKYRTQTMITQPSNDTKMQLRRIREGRPKTRQLSKDLLPIPCHTGETPHSFIVGARYNCSHYMDSRSFARLGLYVPRKNPLQTFLKTYKGEDGVREFEDDSDYVGQTSIQVGNSSGKTQYEGAFHQQRPFNYRSMPPPFIRKVVKEAWLGEDKASNTQPQPYKPPSSSQRSLKSAASKDSNSRKDSVARSAPPRQSSKNTSSKSNSRRSNFNVKGTPPPEALDQRRPSAASRMQRILHSQKDVV